MTVIQSKQVAPRWYGAAPRTSLHGDFIPYKHFKMHHFLAVHYYSTPS